MSSCLGLTRWTAAEDPRVVRRHGRTSTFLWLLTALQYVHYYVFAVFCSNVSYRCRFLRWFTLLTIGILYSSLRLRYAV